MHMCRLSIQLKLYNMAGLCNLIIFSSFTFLRVILSVGLLDLLLFSHVDMTDFIVESYVMTVDVVCFSRANSWK